MRLLDRCCSYASVFQANIKEDEDDLMIDETPSSPRSATPPALASMPEDPPPQPVLSTPPAPMVSSPTLSVEPIIPPGPIPKPIISSTTVVTCKDGVYQCPLCRQNLRSQKDFTTHIRAHNEVKPHPDPNDPTGQTKVYYCCLCSKMLSSFSSLDRHMLVHSGERPFSCELCGQTFTTNGNMHRHKRTHSAKEMQDYSDATGVSLLPSGRRGGRKRKAKEPVQPVVENGTAHQAKIKLISCPKCPEKFDMEEQMNTHAESQHGNEEFPCGQCGATLNGYADFRVHRLFHSPSARPPPLPAAPPQPPSPLSLPRVPLPASLPSFPVPPSTLVTSNTLLSSRPPPPLPAAFFSHPFPPQPHILRPSFGNPSSAFPPPPPTNGKSPERGEHTAPSPDPSTEVIDIDGDEDDPPAVADVKSAEGWEETSALPAVSADEEQHPSNEDAKSDIQADDECSASLPYDPAGAHDDNDPIIKDMKLKGEFPCRLCPAVYPNLRALKGHNKEHLDKPPYACNVGTCTYSSNDKSTLTRHMRTHTGEKPFECRLCGFGFTTKANCERHLKNKHGKTNRQHIRDNLIIHEPEEGAEGGSATVQASVLHKLQAEAQREKGNFRCKVCKQHFMSSELVIEHAVREHPAYSADVDHIWEELKARNCGPKRGSGDLPAPSMVPRTTNLPSLRDLKPLEDQRKESSQSSNASEEEHSGPEDDAPLDLSRPMKDDEASGGGEERSPPAVATPFVDPEILRNQAAMALSLGLQWPFVLPSAAPNSSHPQQLLSAQQALAAAASAGLQGLPIPPPLLPPTSALGLLPSVAGMPGAESLAPEIRQRLQLHQQNLAVALANAGLAPPQITPPASNAGVPLPSTLMAKPATPPPANLAAYLSQQRASSPKAVVNMEENGASSILAAAETLQSLSRASIPTTIVQPSEKPATEAAEKQSDAAAGDNSDSDSNYKMVMHNGVLMRKQKQRRYRTERPYHCQHCSARFTLRSNMERHVKQQHPQFWSSKPRGCRRNHAATVPVLAPQFRPTSLHQLNGFQGSEVTRGQEDGLSGGGDLASVSNLVDAATNNGALKNLLEEQEGKGKLVEEEEDVKEDDGLTDDGSATSERKKSAYSAAPHKISCPFCNRKFPWTSSLQRHILTHTGDKPYKCEFCSLDFTTKSNCDRHQARKHGAGPRAAKAAKMFPCTICPPGTASFSSERSLQKHQCAAHLKMEYPGKDDDVEDSSEEESETNGNGLKSNGNGPATLNGKDHPRTYLCPFCDESFPDRSEVIGHLEIAHPEEYESLVARGAFPDESKMAAAAHDEGANEGEDEAEDEPHWVNRCLFCDGRFGSSEELKRHMRRHTGERPFSCDICHKRFTHRASLLRHRKKHDSGVSSDGESDEEDEELRASFSEPPTLPSATTSPSKKKKPGLMDTIAKLSSRKSQA